MSVRVDATNDGEKTYFYVHKYNGFVPVKTKCQYVLTRQMKEKSIPLHVHKNSISCQNE